MPIDVGDPTDRPEPMVHVGGNRLILDVLGNVRHVVETAPKFRILWVAFLEGHSCNLHLPDLFDEVKRPAVRGRSDKPPKPNGNIDWETSGSLNVPCRPYAVSVPDTMNLGHAVVQVGIIARESATKANLARKSGPVGNAAAFKVDQVRPRGCRPCPTCQLPDGHMRGGEIPGSGPILPRFCRDPALPRDKAPNSGSYGSLGDHSHDITNVNDDGSVPQTAKWNQNFLSPALNNFRQNEQGDIPPTALSDVTSDEVTCMTMGNASVLSAEVCNRGVKTVGAGLKTAFYQGDPADGQVLCVATTMDALEVEQCVVVSCQVNAAVMGEVNVVGNDDGMGGKTTLECIYTNNDATAAPIECK